MGLETAAILALGGAAAGGAGGLISGAMGTPDERATQTQDQTQTSQTTFAPASEDERMLQQQSLQNYLQQVALSQQQESGIGQAQQLQQAALQGQLGLLGGSAFAATPEEQAQIEAIRQAQVGQSQSDVQRFLDERLQQLNTQAGARGVRGQALSQLQGDALRAGAEQLGTASRQAASQAAQSQLALPYQRLQAQSPFLQQGATFADQLRQQAIANRQIAQNPFLLQQLQGERLAGGTQTSRTTGTQNTTQYGQPGSFMGALGGFFGGLGGGAKTGAGIGSILGSGSPSQTEMAGQNTNLRNQFIG